MTRLVCIVMVVVFVCTFATCAAADRKAWRIKLSQVEPRQSDVREYDGGAKGIGIEYSLGDTFKGENSDSEASVYLDYVRLSYVQKDTSSPLMTITNDVTMDVVSFGLNWRYGPGAKPSSEGFYTGAGVGMVFGSPRLTRTDPNFGSLIDEGTQGEFEWRLMAGLNFAKVTFGELTYRKINQDGAYSLSAGFRF